jgi:lipopolysaccharide/colanic/teichoic acid biosynthesis glycosyltransferase
MTKRVFDLLFSLLGIIIFSPLLIMVAIWIKIDSKGPVFFIQQRVGLHGHLIGVLKFRTMVTNAESLGLKITVGADSRITRSGYFLRKYKIDELAQLFNVLRGNMSFVGPRPEVKEYIDVYEEGVRDLILSVKPGITDYASIEFKDENEILANAENPHEVYINSILPIKQKYYLEYISKNNLIIDLKIIFKTIYAILN